MINDSILLIEDALADMVDPELGLSIPELKFIENFGITAGQVDL
jgi:metal-sulfur cluster biosynthetic enzyme|tara:strand:- start:124 stop:255 length:132 start_codon:yes stop_codon:yes gene_type:complete